MQTTAHTRRSFLVRTASTALGAASLPALPALLARAADGDPADADPVGSQRLSLAQLRKWESLQYGMFIHFGMSTFVQKECPDGKAPRQPTPPIDSM